MRAWSSNSERGARDLALREKASAFRPNLLRALRIDSDAAARARGEIVGIDFDPFVGSQDPADHYETRRVTRQDDKCSAEVWRNSKNDTAAGSGKPDVIAESVLDHGHWQFRDFYYPNAKADLLSLRARQQQERR